MKNFAGYYDLESAFNEALREEEENVIDLNNPTVEQVFEYAEQLEEKYNARLTDYTDCIIPHELAGVMMENEMHENGWESAVRLTWHIERINQDYYYLDGKGLLRNLERDHLLMIIEEMHNAI